MTHPIWGWDDPELERDYLDHRDQMRADGRRGYVSNDREGNPKVAGPRGGPPVGWPHAPGDPVNGRPQPVLAAESPAVPGSNGTDEPARGETDSVLPSPAGDPHGAAPQHGGVPHPPGHSPGDRLGCKASG